MFPEDRKEGSPRFGKLHFPVGLWINSPKKRLAKMSRRWPSAGSVRSTSSDTTSRGSETVELRPPGKNKPPRHKRLSNLFHRNVTTTLTPPAAPTGSRWASEKKLAELVDPNSEVLGGGGLENNNNNPPPPRQPPGILKIFGGDLSRGANYKSVLATPRSTARQLVREALERYGVTPQGGEKSGKDGEGVWGGDEFVLCDVVGRVGGPGGGWQVEHLRAVGDGERPLVLQDVWKPKSGCSRRFEIRRRKEVERVCQGEEEEEEEEETPGLDAQARRLQKSRSRAASGGPTPPKERSQNLSLRRSISDMNLSTRRRRERKAVLSVAGGDAAAAVPPPGDEGPPDNPPPRDPSGERGEEEEEEEEEGGAALEQLSQCLIQPPQQHPYFLLLQGYGKQDFVIYVMTRPQHIFGRPPERRGGVGGAPEKTGGSPLVVDTFLDAPDILPRHCLVRAAPQGGGGGGGGGTDPPEPPSNAPPRPSATVRPFRGAPVTHNGAPLLRQAPLNPGDLLGLGQHFLFLYKDPRDSPSPRPPPWLPPPAETSPGLGGALGCPGCGRSPQERQEALRNLLESPRPELRFRPQEEEALLREIVRLPEGFGGAGGGSGGGGGGPWGGVGALAPAFLLGLCLEHAARALPPERFPVTLGRVARLVKETVWEKIKEIGDRQPENQQEAPPPAPSVEGVMADLRPLMLWLANATELLNLAQGRVLELEKELELEGPCQELTGDLEACDEALGVLDEVIMSTFQQSVYYLTKTLYWSLPALLESNPFSGSGEPSAVGQDLAGVPEGVRPTLSLFQAALELTRDVQLHPDLVSQTFGYLFFFSNASLFNTLMEKGGAGPFFQWWRAVRIRSNLDLVLEGLTALGLGDIAGEFFRKLSATANLLCTPRSCLTKATWSRLRAEFPALAPAQLHHLLRHYQLGLGRAPPPAWSPPPEERDTAATGDIFESFSEHPPLLLPTQGFQLRPGEPPPPNSCPPSAACAAASGSWSRGGCPPTSAPWGWRGGPEPGDPPSDPPGPPRNPLVGLGYQRAPCGYHSPQEVELGCPPSSALWGWRGGPEAGDPPSDPPKIPQWGWATNRHPVATNRHPVATTAPKRWSWAAPPSSAPWGWRGGPEAGDPPSDPPGPPRNPPVGLGYQRAPCGHPQDHPRGPFPPPPPEIKVTW